jgi:hypothetical protein
VVCLGTRFWIDRDSVINAPELLGWLVLPADADVHVTRLSHAIFLKTVTDEFSSRTRISR